MNSICDDCIWAQNGGCYEPEMIGGKTQCNDHLEIEQFLFDTEQGPYSPEE